MLAPGIETFRAAIDADQRAEMLMPRLGANTPGQVPEVDGAVFDAIAIADLVAMMLRHEGMAAGMLKHRLVERRLVAFELYEQVVTGGDHKVSGFFGCGVHPW